MRRRHELTDAQRAEIEQLLPGKRSDPSRTAADIRALANACLWISRTGAARVDLHKRFGKYSSAWKRCDLPAAAAAGVRERVGQALGDEDLAGEASGEVQEEVRPDRATVEARPTTLTRRRSAGEPKMRPTTAAAPAAAGAGSAPSSTPPSAA